MKKRYLYALLLAAGLSTASVQAADAFDLEHLKQLFNNYQRQQAYDYASRYLGEMEGDGNFDYLYGVAAIDAGHASQGVFALERVLMQFPNDQVARLELARGYFILEEFARSRQEFEKVLAVNPPQAVRETTEGFLEQIRLKEARYRTTTGGFIAIGLGSDSNASSGPDDSNPYGNGIPLFPLSSTSISQSDTYSELSASWGVGHPFAPGWMATGNLTAVLHRNQEWDQFNTTTAAVQAGISRIYKQSRYKGELLYQQYTIDGFDENNRDLSGLTLDWQYDINQKSQVSTGLQYVSLAYPNDDSKDSSLSTLTLAYTRSFNTLWTPTYFISLNVGQETPADDTESTAVLHDRDLSGFRIGSILSLDSSLALQIAAGIQSSSYPEATYFDLNLQPFDIERQDDYTTANINLLWLINKDWRLDTRLSYSKNDSNVQIYSYDRTTIGLEVNYSF